MARRRRAADTLGLVRPLGRDQSMVPAQDRVRCDDGRDLHQELASDPLALGCQPAALVVVQPRDTAAELFSQDSVLLDEVVEHLALAMVQPACE